MNSQNQIKKICVAIASSLVLVVLAAPNANAVVLDPNIYAQYQSARTRLLVKETDLLKDFDSLQKQIDLLKKQNDDRSLTPTIDGLCRAQDQTFADLQKVRQDIKSLDLKML
jgi:peptidoglycan hydrolase CwlO-like protein